MVQSHWEFEEKQILGPYLRPAEAESLRVKAEICLPKPSGDSDAGSCLRTSGVTLAERVLTLAVH